MSMLKKFFVVVLLIVFLQIKFSLLIVTSESATGAIILSQPIGARASGMGEAYTTSKGDVLGIYYNPSCSYDKLISVLYQRGIAEDNFGVIGFGYPTEIGNFAGSVLYYSAGSIELINLQEEEKTVNAQTDFLVTISYSKKFGELSFGGNSKFLSSKLVEEVSANTFAFDLGSNYQIIDDMIVGLSVQNIGGKLKYLDEGDKIPLTIRLGSSYKIPLADSHFLLTALDIVKVNDNKIKLHTGFEYTYELYSLRAGYKIGYDTDKLTFGCGYLQDRYSIDYAISIMGELGLIHRVSLNYKFGDIEETKTKKKKGKIDKDKIEE